VERATLKAGGQPRRQRFGRADGLRLYGVASPTPAIARDRGGHIWVCTQDGAAVFDPERLRRNPLPPPLTIEQVTVDGKSLDTTSHEVWFPGRTVQIAYTAVSLNSPELVRFRYRLIGVDPNWVDAGSRRNVAYAHLSPGGYRFRVTAANNDGPWNENVAEMVLYVEPYFYETYWFRAAVASAVLLMCWAAYRIRVRTLQSRWELIAAERAKFSRELHDSLLQGFSGVVFLLEAAAKKFDSAPEKSRKDLMKALDRADNSLREARQLVTDLRIPALENSTLPQALRETSHQMVHGMPVHFEFEVHGSAKPAHYDVDANLFLIGREALSNSLSHAGANRIRMELQYTSKGLGLTVEDDGSGFDPEMARAKEGHQGFRGMEERAKNIGGALAVESAGGKGTKIVVRVPWK
jgi:signal transduction histidine kinase